MKRLLFLVFLFWASPLFAQLQQTPNLGLNVIPFGYPNFDVPLNQNTVILDTKIPTLNLSCQNGQVPTWANGQFSVCGSASIDLNAAYTWNGNHAFLKGVTINAKQVCLADGTNCPAAGNESDPVIKALKGIVAGTGAGVNARIITGTASKVVVTNGDGIAGNPTITVGSLVVQPDQANTYTAGDQDFSLAASLKVPGQAGAAPTASRVVAYDNTSNRLKYGANGVTFTIANTAEIQPLNANLTGISVLSPSANQSLVYRSGWTLYTRPSCNAANQAVNYDSSTGTEGCVTFTGGLSGMTPGAIQMALTASTIGDTVISQSGGNVTIAGGLNVGNVGTDSLDIDGSAYVGHGHIPIVVPYVGATPSFALTTGALVNGEVVKINASGALVSGGPAGTGTWDDTSVNTGTHKTFDFVGGAGNVIKLPLYAPFDGAGLTPDGTNCTDATKVTLNSGPAQYVMVCPTTASAQFDAMVPGLKYPLATLTATLIVNDVDSSAQHFAGTFKAMCRGNGDSVNSTWGSTQTVNITMTTANVNYTGTTAAITPNGTCLADDTLYIRFDANGSMTDDGDARIIGLILRQAS